MIPKRFQTRVVTLMIVVVAIAQLATFAVVTLATERAVGNRLADELEVGRRVWEQFQQDRAERLLSAASVLVDDFGFRAAVATGDVPTIVSALDNHGSRIATDAIWLLSPDGEWVAGGGGMREPAHAVLHSLVTQAATDGFAVESIAAGGEVMQVVVLPVLAPQRVGWLAVGQTYDDALAIHFARLTGLDASFVVAGADGRDIVSGSTLPLEPRGQLVAALASMHGHPDALELGGRHYMVASQSLLPGGEGGHIVLKASFDAAMAPYRTLRQRIIALAGIATALAILAALLLGRSVSRPVARLADAARRIQAGDYSLPPRIEGGGEIADLAGAFGRMQSDISAREDRIRHQASHDGLTGLPNRGSAREWLEAAIHGDGDGRPLAVMIVDLDRFKEINDTLGHEFGDQVLREVAMRLRGHLDGRYIVARLGGDEFMVLMPDTSEAEALAQARSILFELREPLELPRTRINVDGSIGVALYPQHGGDPDTLLRRADIAMYEAKAAHIGVAVYEPGRDELHLRQLTMMADMRSAIEAGQFTLKFQPKMDVASGRVVHAEALLRWTHAGFGEVRPDEFIPLAERSGFIHELTRFVLDEALRANAEWRKHGLDLGLAVNLSAMDLMDADLPGFIDARLAVHGVPASRLIIEVTESVLMRDIDYAIRMLDRLKAGGVRLAIDDFGTGYSSLAQLKRMPVDELKIDKSFVMQLEDGSDDAVIVRSTIELGHNMGLSVIAEGVENDEALALLKRYRCDMAQGYLFSPPLDSDGLVAWCEEWRNTGGVGPRLIETEDAV